MDDYAYRSSDQRVVGKRWSLSFDKRVVGYHVHPASSASAAVVQACVVRLNLGRMSLDVDKNKGALVDAWKSVVDDKDPTNW
jgi:hypothetical protein